jgi:uncharacterized protein (DUF2267 family)
MAREEAVLVRRPEVVEVTKEEIVNFRSELSKVIRDFWASPAGQVLKDRLSFQAHASGFAAEMSKIMGGVRERIRAAAEKAKLSQAYKAAWGK